jgi:hypothetical protein
MTVSISKPAIALRRALELTGEMNLERTEFAIALALAVAVVRASQAQAVTGTDAVDLMTSLTTKQAFVAHGPLFDNKLFKGN